MTLKDKHIILGITGSIAAYKAAYIIRGLVKKGAGTSGYHAGGKRVYHSAYVIDVE